MEYTKDTGYWILDTGYWSLNLDPGAWIWTLDLALDLAPTGPEIDL